MRENREVRRKYFDSSFIRKADGRLRPSDERDIKDIWAELDRVKLKGAIEHDEKKRARRVRRRALFGSVENSSKATDADARTVEIKINFPEFSLAGLKVLLKGARRWFGKFSRKQYVALGAAVVFIGLFAASFSLYGGNTKDKDDVAKKVGPGAVQGVVSDIPQYKMVLPVGKTIDELGGWTRVSPEGKDPAYAFDDQIDGVPIVVSQQLLPEGFKDDTETAVSRLATDFNADQPLVAGDSKAFLGTSAQGPQSVILTKGDILVFAKSASKLSATQWEHYLATLQ